MDKNNKTVFKISLLNQFICRDSFFYSSNIKYVLISIISIFYSCSSYADLFKEEKADSVLNALEKGKAHLDFRLRYEDVNKGNQGAQALTLRSRLGFETLPYELFRAFVEFDDVRAIPSDDNYFSGANAQFDDLFIEDPEGTEINQAWIAYDISNTLIKYGRQTLSLNNERLLGGDKWRQNEQTFSALSIQNETLNYLRFEFMQINQVQTNQDDVLESAHQDINAKLLNINYRGFWLNDLSFYALWISDHPDDKAWESATYGIHFAGDLGGDFSVAYQLDLARQEDAGDNTANYSVGYSLIDFVFGYQGMHLALGYEYLGAEADGYFVSPLGSVHEFQGATDQFTNDGLGNVPGGIQDIYLGLGYKLDYDFGYGLFPLSFEVKYHDFSSVKKLNGLTDLGEEWVLGVSLILDNYDISLQYSDYHAAQFSEDENRAWLSMSASF